MFDLKISLFNEWTKVKFQPPINIRCSRSAIFVMNVWSLFPSFLKQVQKWVQWKHFIQNHSSQLTVTLLSQDREPQVLWCSKTRMRQCYFSNAWAMRVRATHSHQYIYKHCNKIQNQKCRKTDKIYRRNSNAEINTSEIDSTHWYLILSCCSKNER